MSDIEPLVTSGKNHYTKYYIKKNDLVYFVRKHHWPVFATITEAFSSGWLLFIGSFSLEGISVVGCNEVNSSKGLTAVFVPPFSVMEWEVKQGSYQWEAYGSLQMDPSLPTVPSSFSWHPSNALESTTDLVRVLKNSRDLQILKPHRSPSAVACKLKAYLDQYFSEDTSIGDISKRLKIPYSTLALEFKKGFGLSPVNYRNQIRIKEAVRIMGANNTTASVTAKMVGFKNFSNFYRNFRRYMATSPSSFVKDKIEGPMGMD